MTTQRPRKIIHVDMDCFYAAVEVKHNPDLRGLALGIGGSAQGRGVLCTASYEARKFNVRAAMSSSLALKLCPHLVLIPPNFPLYKKESQAVREIFSRYAQKIEPLSLDEAYLDVTDSTLCGGSATLMAREIRSLIFNELKLTASAGIAPNKFLAKVASDWRKPNGQFVIEPKDVLPFVTALAVEKIHGVGKVTAEKMHSLGFKTCGDMQRASQAELVQHFGSRGESLFHMARGRDEREVESHSERKSLTVEETYIRDIPTLSEALSNLPKLFGEWKRRMQKGDFGTRIQSAVVKLKFFDFKSTTHEKALRLCPEVGDFEELLRAAWSRRNVPVRLIGLGVRLKGESAAPLQLSFDF